MPPWFFRAQNCEVTNFELDDPLKLNGQLPHFTKQLNIKQLLLCRKYVCLKKKKRCLRAFSLCAVGVCLRENFGSGRISSSSLGPEGSRRALFMPLTVPSSFDPHPFFQ